MPASTHTLVVPFTSSFSHSTHQLAFSAFSSIQIPQLRTVTSRHLHHSLSFPSLTFSASSTPFAFLSGRLGSSADQHNHVSVAGDLNPVGILEEREEDAQASSSDIIHVCVETIGRNKRRITASIPINVPLEAVWHILTDYEGLAEFLPGLAVSQLQDQWENGARLLQIGEQNLAFGVKFRAKGVINVHERPVEVIPCGIRRDVDFEMIEGDFKIFNGTWSMEQTSTNTLETSELPISGSAISTRLTYKLEVQPEIWLPVALLEGRLGKEIQTNLVCVRDEALRRHLSLHVD